MFISDIRKAISQNQWRNYYLALIAIGTNVVTIYALINPYRGDRDLANFRFPQQIQLNSETLSAIQKSGSLVKDSPESPVNLSRQETIKSKQQYQSIKNGSDTILEISYLVNTRGDVESYLQQYTDISSEAVKNQTIAHIDPIGYHSLLEDSDRAYLSSCISPRSPSNVTQRQFSNNRYQNDLKLKIGWEWLQGKSSIRDRRCLWVQLSTPLMSNSQTAYENLEAIWREVYPWLSQNFPALN